MPEIELRGDDFLSAVQGTLELIRKALTREASLSGTRRDARQAAASKSEESGWADFFRLFLIRQCLDKARVA